MMKSISMRTMQVALAALLFVLGGFSVSAQTNELTPVTLGLEDAIQIALENNLMLQSSKLSLDDADAQIKAARGSALPQINLAAQYVRNLKTANPFAGSSAGSFFDGLGALDWLAFNENARTDGNEATEPISLGEFRRRQGEGYQKAGIVLDTDANPFAVDNQFTNGLTISQVLFDRRVGSALKGARYLREINELALSRQEQMVIAEVQRAFYAAMLTSASVEVTGKSVERTTKTYQETAKRVAQGVSSKFDRLSIEVELSNLKSGLYQIENQAQLALNSLKTALALPVEQPVILRGSLENAYSGSGEFMTVSLDEAVVEAIDSRPDLEQALSAIKFQESLYRTQQASSYPSLNAFANLNYIGSVPDNRSLVLGDPNDPFRFTQGNLGFFSKSYWNPAINVGVSLQWNLFNGFQNRANRQRARIEVMKSEINYQQALLQVRSEAHSAELNLRSALEQIRSQESNIERAQLNYEYSARRLAEGIGSPFQERQASELLDQSNLSYLQAIHDYLQAKAAYDLALGRNPLADSDANTLTRNDGK